MSIQIYKITRQGAMAVRFQGRDGTDFTDPTGLKNPQISKLIGNRLMCHIRCEVSTGEAEVLGEASPDEIATYEGRLLHTETDEEDDNLQGPIKLFPIR